MGKGGKWKWMGRPQLEVQVEQIQWRAPTWTFAAETFTPTIYLKWKMIFA